MGSVAGHQVILRQEQRRGSLVEGGQGSVAGRSRNVARFGRQVRDDCLVGSRVGVGDLRLNGLVERQGFDLVGTRVVAVLYVIVRDADVPDGAEVEDGVVARVNLLRGGLVGGIVHVGGRLLGLGHGLAQRHVDGALAPEIGFAL